MDRAAGRLWHADWRVATTLPEAGARRYGFGRYRGADYDELVDHQWRWDVIVYLFDVAARGTRLRHRPARRRHSQALPRPGARLLRAGGVFEPRAPRRAPFQVMAVGDGYGGLKAPIEHRADLLAPTTGAPPAPGGLSRLPRAGEPRVLPHLNVSGPAHSRYDLQHENTRACCGSSKFTSYYDDDAGALRRHRPRHLVLLAKAISADARTGRRRERGRVQLRRVDQIYRQDENRAERDRELLREGVAGRAALDLIAAATGEARSTTRCG